ncbi:MAG: hypothetical protein C0511_03415 [Hyphomicrobium sp.]|nr:hypothetical protein [Hyphomicrobium sp.]PPC83270.1 MAG: hypothetical protein CTY40_02875 [Hyphomicrobium sp.]
MAANRTHHGDRGVQHVSITYTERLAKAGVVPWVGSVRDSYDVVPEARGARRRAGGARGATSCRRRAGRDVVPEARGARRPRRDDRRALQSRPAAAGASYYASLGGACRTSAWLEPNSLRRTRGGSIGPRAVGLHQFLSLF